MWQKRLGTGEQMGRMVQGAVGKRLRYEDLIGPTDSRLSSGL